MPDYSGLVKKKVFTVSDDLFFAESISKEEKMVFTSSDDLFSAENIGEKQKKGLYVLRC